MVKGTIERGLHVIALTVLRMTLRVRPTRTGNRTEGKQRRADGDVLPTVEETNPLGAEAPSFGRLR